MTRRSIRGIAAAVGMAVAAVGMAACGAEPTSSSGPSEPVPQELRDLDVAAGIKAQPQGDYDAAFKTLSSRCQEQGVGLGNEVGEVLKLLQKGHVTDENRLTVMQHMGASVPAGSAKMKCSEVGGAYVTLRTSG